jgi:hypothetical protein
MVLIDGEKVDQFLLHNVYVTHRIVYTFRKRSASKPLILKNKSLRLPLRDAFLPVA